MNLYIIDDVECLTTNYHAGGGLVVVARDLEAAKAAAAREHWPVEVSDAEWASARTFPLAEPADEEVTVFPDAGCC